MGTESFPGIERQRRGADHPPRPSADDKERVELHLYSPSEPSWTVTGQPLPLHLYHAADLATQEIVNAFKGTINLKP